MKLKTNKRRIVTNILAVLLVLLVTVFATLHFINTKKTQAAPDGTVEVRVNKVTTVSIYAFGPGVEFVSSTGNFDTYYVERGTTLRLQAVNETRIFTDWVFQTIPTGSGVGEIFTPIGVSNADLGNIIINVPIDANTDDFSVTVNRRDATAEDYGKYMLDRFVIADEADLIALQNILAGSNSDKDYALYFESPSQYDTNEKKEVLREKLRYGYFLISNNFTVFNESFTGIGTSTKPFQGVMCGLNGKISKLFITITQDEAENDSYYGLFKYLGNEAVIRNLIVSTSIGITPVAGNGTTSIYAGGLAAKMERSTLVDVEVSASISIESNKASKIYAGGIAGVTLENTGIDSISDVVFEGTESNWTIVSHQTNSEIHAGLIAGSAIDTYIKEVDIITTDLSVDLKNDSIDNQYTNSKLYLGNVFGSYIARNASDTLDDIMIMGNAGESLRAMTTNGDAVVGGLIGYVDASSTGRLNLERVYFRVSGSESEYSASTITPTSVGNTYAGGIIGYINGTNAYALDAFRRRFDRVEQDQEQILAANYLYMGSYRISAIQNGKSLAITNGKAIAGGLIGSGLFGLNGTDGFETNLALAAPNSELTVEAIQTKLTSTNGNINDKEHACAALIYGSVGIESIDRNNNVTYKNITMSNINVYSNNTTVQTIREIGSKAKGDLHTGGFISFAGNNSTFTNINMYLNDSKIKAESLSYEKDAMNTNEDTNSAFCGGFTGELIQGSTLSNFMFAGFDTSLFNIIGTTSCVESIQNTVPGGNNYMGENYIGGVVGRIQKATLLNCIFKGSETNKDYIRMSGHESPDSAFCGGIVGLIRTDGNGMTSTVTGCEVIDTEVIGNATNVSTTYSDPDIYIGGIIGATYIHETDSKITVSDCSVIGTSVYALGNEIITAFAGGIIGGSTWESNIEINDCYVFESSIRSNVSMKISNTKTLESTAGGIMGGMKGTAPNNKYVDLKHCAVIDTDVDAKANSTYTNISAYAAGVLGFMSDSTRVRLTNCYSNATVTSSHLNLNGRSNVYGITQGGTIQTTQKSVTSTVTRVLYQTFTHNNYTFEVVSQENGTYRIRNSSGQYVRINRNQLAWTNNSNQRATFTYNNGNLVYSSRYIGFDNNGNITYSNSTYNFSSYIKTTSEEYTGNSNVNANNSYYLNKNVKNSDNNLGTAVGTGPFNVPSGSTVSPYSGYDYLYGFDGSGQKFFIEIIDNKEAFTANNILNQVTSVTGNIDNKTALAHIWINAKNDGGDIEYDGKGNVVMPKYTDKLAAAEEGWFILDYVLLYSGSIAEIVSTVSDLQTSYTKGNLIYRHQLEGTTHFVVNENDSLDKIANNYSEVNYIDNINGEDFTFYEYTFKVYDDMLKFNANFNLTHFGANYYMRFLDESGNFIEENEFIRDYGNIELTLQEKHSASGHESHTDAYLLEYTPNEDIEEDFTFYIRFIGGNNAVASNTIFKINLKANKLNLVGVTYADYTPPLNYYLNSPDIGSDSNPYELYVGSITKFIPVFTKINDINPGTRYALEEYIEKCNYTITSNTSNFTVHSNGELIVSNNQNQTGILTVNQKNTENTQTVYVHSARDINVAYEAVGAEITGLTHASNTTDFYFEQEIRSNYSGEPTKFIITINGQKYDLSANPSAYDTIKVYEKDKNGNMINVALTSYDSDIHNYVVEINKSIITGNINIEVEYPVVCIVTFKLQCEAFNDIGVEASTKTFKVVSGTTFKDYFSTIKGETTKLQEIEDWVDENTLFGYVFTGFYLVSDSNSIHSYGAEFKDLVQSNYKINSSNTFYGRWSYLIELVEAPGTYIKTGFNSEFMQDYKGDGFSSTIQIPINANQGYVFRVDKDNHYVGDIGVEAYIIDSSHKMISIPIEYYQDNKNLYYIRPEYITGYLVIMTTVGNSEVIVGEHTSSVTENIAPEDGIITFKYIVNHYYENDNSGNGPKSYIFNLAGGLNYETLNKEFVLDFYKQSTHTDLKLPDFTEIRVYYNCYVDGNLNPVNTIVGTYITYNDDRVYLSEFKKLDLETSIFDSITFKQSFENALGGTLTNNYKITEVFYFSIIPPNGYSSIVENEMANYVVECGFVKEKAPVVDGVHQDVEYLKGMRTTISPVNSALNSVLQGENIYESSKQEKVYHVTPSRDTSIKKETDGSYTFTDNNTYSVYDIILTDTQKLPNFNYISLYDYDKQSILESSTMRFNIKELRLKLGYRLGELKVYGYDPTLDEGNRWVEIGIIEVTSAVYSDYVIDFKGNDPKREYPFNAFKIDNISTNEIRVSQIDVVSNTNGVLYEGPISSFVEKEATATGGTYTLTNQIIGDSRHDGKIFMLAIQLSNNGNIVDNINGNVYITVNNIGLGVNHYVNINEHLGKNVGYINLTEIITTLNVKEINFNITIPDGYSIHVIQLIEVVNEYKPAQGEVRGEIN